MINFNGEISASGKELLSVNNRGFTYGDLVFETIRVINSRIIFWEDHYFRLMASMRIMRMDIPSNFSPEFLETEILALVKANKLEKSPARIRFSVFREEGGLYSPTDSGVDYIITAKELAEPFYLLKQDFVEVELFKDHYISSGLLSTLKTNNRAINVLGSIFAKENSFQNCLLLNENKSVVEALNGNIFLISGNTIKTPPLTDGCINGILRRKLIEVIKTIPEYTLLEESISPFELQKADEIFFTNVIQGIRSINKYRKKTFGDEVAKILLPKLNAKARFS